MSTVSKAFGASALKLRLAAGLYQRQVAAAAGISTATVRNCEQGKGVTLDSAVGIATVLKSSVDRMLAGEEPSGG